MLPQHLFALGHKKKKRKTSSESTKRIAIGGAFRFVLVSDVVFSASPASAPAPAAVASPAILLAVCFSCFLLTIRSHDTNWLVAWPARDLASTTVRSGSNDFGYCSSISSSFGAGATNPVNTESLLPCPPLRCSWPIIAH